MVNDSSGGGGDYQYYLYIFFILILYTRPSRLLLIHLDYVLVWHAHLGGQGKWMIASLECGIVNVEGFILGNFNNGYQVEKDNENRW